MKDIGLILGIRPDVIRASKIIKLLSESSDIDFDFIWSGQHYSENMRDVFFNQLNVPVPDYEFNIDIKNDATTVSSIINETYTHLENHKYKAVMFLGDTNTVMGSIGVAQHNIPIVHIEGCMRSYDWRMPEEKYRKTIDHLSDRIYSYLPSYKKQGLNEGISKNIIKVTGNPIVDILEEFKDFFSSGWEYLDENVKQFINDEEFLLVTSHRRENILNKISLKNIVDLINSSEKKVLFPMGYSTQRQIKDFGFNFNDNVLVIDPIGYLEFIYLLKKSQYCISDSGTVVEEACILNIPSIQMRYSTERPEVYEVGSSIKFDPTLEDHKFEEIHSKVDSLKNTEWLHPFGDGTSSKAIVEDLIDLSKNNKFHMHNKENYDFDISRSFLQ
jgi:UDP-N-acetylglucosamine 2-epimerase (non-hydrolysing)